MKEEEEDEEEDEKRKEREEMRSYQLCILFGVLVVVFKIFIVMNIQCLPCKH